MKHADIFHGILNYLYKFPLNGEEIDLRKELNKPKYNIYNSLDGRNAYARLQVVIEYLQNKNYIEFNQRQMEYKITGGRVVVKYGEDPTVGKGGLEATFDTTYPMAILKIDGYDYITQRKNKFSIWKIIGILSALTTIITGLILLIQWLIRLCNPQ